MSDEREDLAALVAGDTYLSETWAVVVDGQAVELDDGDGGWTVHAAAAHPRTGAVVVAFADAEILPGTADVRVGSTVVSTSTVRLHLAPARTGMLPVEQLLNLEVWVTHPDHGPGESGYRATLVEAPLLIVAGQP